MEILWLLVPLSVLIVLVIGVMFWWSIRNGQFDDLDGPAYRILADDDEPAESSLEEQATMRPGGASGATTSDAIKKE